MFVSVLILGLVISGLDLTMFKDFVNRASAAGCQGNPNIQVRFDEDDGTFYFQTTSTKGASGNKRYRTVGWQVHKEPSPSRNPKADFGANNVAILNIQQYDEQPANAPPGTPVTTFFRVEFDQLNAALAQRGLYELESGEPVYLSALTQFIQPNQEQPSGPIYDNYDELVRNANMPHIDFTQYFNICVIYHSPEVPVKKRVYIDGDILVDEKDQGKYKPGQPVQVRFDETITYNGQTYEIYKSWLSPISNESLVTWLQDLSDNDPTNDKVAVRDFTTFVSGTIVKGYYRLKQQDDDCTTNPYLPECGGSDPGGPDPGTGGSSGSCTWTISAPSGGTRQTGSVMNPNATGQIAADGVFDVVQGIPTSETTNVV